MGTLKIVDAIGSAEITGGPFDGVCFYIGGDAFRIWPIAEVEGRPERYRLPIWVRSNPQQVNPAEDAAACIAALMKYGVPTGTLVALDSETAIDPAWTAVFVEVVNGASVMQGWPVIDYGTQGDVFSNNNPDGYYWGADWTSVPHIHSGDGMTQYLSLNNEDISLAQSTLPLWDTRPDPPQPKPAQEEPVQGQLAFDVKGNAIIDLGAAGTFKAIGFASDWSLEGTVQTELRVAIHRYNPAPAGTFEVKDSQLIPKSGKLVIELPTDADYASVRLEAGTAPVSYGAS